AATISVAAGSSETTRMERRYAGARGVVKAWTSPGGTFCAKVPGVADAGTSLARLAVAALVGFLIGLDRERAEARKARELVAGVRTFPLIALAGALPLLVDGPTGVALLVT